jgi:hypothetical protein
VKLEVKAPVPSYPLEVKAPVGEKKKDWKSKLQLVKRRAGSTSSSK